MPIESNHQDQVVREMSNKLLLEAGYEVDISSQEIKPTSWNSPIESGVWIAAGISLLFTVLLGSSGQFFWSQSATAYQNFVGGLFGFIFMAGACFAYLLGAVYSFTSARVGFFYLAMLLPVVYLCGVLQPVHRLIFG